MSRKGRRAKVRLAQAEANLKYGPQLSELEQILSGLKLDLHAGVHQARIGGRINARAARQAIPVLQRAYKHPSVDIGAADKMVNSQLAGLPANSPFRTAAVLDQGVSKKNLADELAMNVSSMAQRATDARVGAEQNVQSLRAQYHQDAGKAIDQIKSTLGQQGLYASTAFHQLVNEAAGRRVTLHGQKVSAQNSKRSQRGQNKRFGQTENDKYVIKYGHTKAEVLAASPGQRKHWANQVSSSGSKSGKKWATPTQAGSIQDAISAATSDAKRLKSLHLSRAKASLVLQDRKAAAKFGVSVPRGLYRTAALDLAYLGFISRPTRHSLRQRGFRPHHYGLPIKPPKHRPRPKPKPTGGNVGGAVGNAFGGSY